MKSLWQIVSQVIGIPRILYEMRLYADIKDTKKQKQKQKWKREQMKWEINKSKWKKYNLRTLLWVGWGVQEAKPFAYL